jgi:protein TonB
MFEQPMLLEGAPGGRTRALAASLTIQVLIVGVLALVPLIYSDRLPALQPWTSIAVPLPRALPEPEPVKRSTEPQSRPSILPSHVFRSPLTIPQSLDYTPTILADGVPFAPEGFGSPVGVPLSFGPSLPHLIVEPPHVSQAATVKEPEKPHAVGGDVQAAKLVRRIVPVYPPLARQARVSGTVHLVGVIAKDGTIQQLQVVSGNPLLVQAALDAVRQWVYKPTLLNGQAVEVIAPIDVIFTLSQ